MTKQEIQKEIDDLKYRLFLEQMADFMDWEAYHRINNRIRFLETELERS